MDNKKIAQKKFKIGISIIFFVLFLGFLFINKKVEENILKIGNTEIKIEIANDDQSRIKGLSGRDSLEEDEGMLFIFDYPDKHSFWMKEMNFPIDIIWLDDNKKIVFIKKEARPESYPESFSSPIDSLYVLEVNASFSDKNNLKVGDEASFLSS